MGKTVFVTGGAGFIGSHCVLALLEAGYEVIAIDNFANSIGDGDKAVALERVEEITGKKLLFYHVDMLDRSAMNDIFKKVSFFLFEVAERLAFFFYFEPYPCDPSLVFLLCVFSTSTLLLIA